MYSREAIQAHVLQAVAKALGRELSPEERQTATPPQGDFGDIAYGCFVVAKHARTSANDIAERLVRAISEDSIIKKVVAAGPYANFYIHTSVFQKELSVITKERHAYGKEHPKKPKTIMVEFGQPNTHKAFHVGHVKSAISGLGIVRLLENAGHKVIKANYYGDIGLHVAKSTWGVEQKGIPDGFASWDRHEKMRYIDEGYVLGAQAFDTNPAAAEAMKQINNDIYSGKNSPSTRLYRQIKDWSLDHIQHVFAELGVSYDVQYPESSIFQDAITIVKKHIGPLFSESDGAIIYDGKKHGLTTWVFLTQEGNPTYSAKDLALGIKKFKEYPLDQNITLTSVEQIDYFQVVIRCLETIAPELRNKYTHLPFGWLLRDNKKTSSREGGTIKGMDVIMEARDVAKERIGELKQYSDADKERISKVVATAGLKFMILSHEFRTNINYDPKKFISFEGFSGPYVLYAYVRTQSLLRKVRKGFFTKKDVLTHPMEISLAKKLTGYPEMARRAAADLAPHLLCSYVHEVASLFNAFYTTCPVMDAPSALRQARRELTEATGVVLGNGLRLLGIDTIDEM